MKRQMAAALAALGWLAAISLAAEPYCPRLEGHWGWGGSYAVGTGAGLGLFASGATLVLVDWPGVSELRELGLGRVDGWPTDFVISGTTAFVSVQSYGLQIFDLESAGGPSLLGAWRSTASPRALDVASEHAFVADVVGLRVLDVSEPRRPVEVAALDLDSEGGGYDVELNGHYAFVTTGYELAVVDVQRPEDPFVIARLALDGYYPLLALDGSTVWLAGGEPGLVAVDVRDALVAVVAERAGADPDTLVLIDVSDPSNPVVISEVPTPGRSSLFSDAGVVLSGDLAVVSLGLENGIRVFDVRNPFNPQLLGERTSEFLGSHGMAVAGEHLFVAGGNAGVDGYRLGSCRAPRRPERRRAP